LIRIDGEYSTIELAVGLRLYMCTKYSSMFFSRDFYFSDETSIILKYWKSWKKKELLYVSLHLNLSWKR